MTKSKYQASCFCGAVTFTLEGEPKLMAYCHCDSCRHWSASPVSAFTLWKPDSLAITKGKDKLVSYDKNSSQLKGDVMSNRTWCSCCGGHVFTDHPQMGFIDVPAAIVDGLEFKPAQHVFYGETVLRIADDLPKYKDLPAPAGGSGELIDE